MVGDACELKLRVWWKTDFAYVTRSWKESYYNKETGEVVLC